MPLDQKEYLLPTDYSGGGPFNIIALWMNRVGTMINNMHAPRGGSVVLNEQWIRFNMPREFPWGKIRFGFTVDGQEVTIKAGSVTLGKQTKDVPETTVTITGGDATTPQIIYVRFAEATGVTSAEIPLVPVTTVPRPNDTYWQKPLFAFYWDGAAVTMKTSYWLGGDIDVTGRFA